MNYTNQNLPIVSVIIPVFNGTKFIDDCLSRLLIQDYPKEKLEILVVDNNSTDDSVKQLSKFPVKIIHCSTPGPAAARNVGISNCSGEIVLFIDIDCLADINLVKNHVEAHLKLKWTKPDVQMVCGGINGHNRNFWSLCDDFCSWSLFHPDLKPRRITRMCPTANLSIQRSVFDKTGSFNEDLRFGEDFAFCHTALKNDIGIYFEPKAFVLHINRTSFREFMEHAKDWAMADEKLYDIGVLPIHRNFIFFLAFYTAFLGAFMVQPIFSGLSSGRFIVLALFPFLFINRFYIWTIRVNIHYQKRKIALLHG